MKSSSAFNGISLKVVRDFCEEALSDAEKPNGKAQSRIKKPFILKKGAVPMDNNGLDYYKTLRLTLLLTDESEPEWMFKNIYCKSDEMERQNGEACIFYRLRYESPIQQFTGIRKLLLSMRRSMGMHSTFCGTIGIDVAAWKNHENEEYFQILLKFLYDNGRDWNMVFVCSQYGEQDFLRLKYHCINFFVIESRMFYLYSRGILESNIRNAFTEMNCEIEPDAVTLLAEALRSCSSFIKSLFQKLPRIVCELLQMAGFGAVVSISKSDNVDTPFSRSNISSQRSSQNLVVSEGLVCSYLNNPAGLVGMIRGMADCSSPCIA